MKKILLGLVLTVMATAASAEWVFVDDGVPSGNNYYADPATKKRTGNLVRVWEMTDYGKPATINGKAFQSDRSYNQYDCVERTFQYLQITAFAGKMATGEIVATDNHLGNVNFIPPKSVGEVRLNFACQ